MYPASFIYIILDPSVFPTFETIRQAFREIVPDSCNRKMMLNEEKKREEIAYMYSVSVIMQTSVVQSNIPSIYLFLLSITRPTYLS